MTTEVEKLAKYLFEDNNVKNFHVTTSYELGLTDKRPTAEEIAGEVNRINEWLSDPVNNLTSRIEGHIMLKKDTIMCNENKTHLIKEAPYIVAVPMTDAESREVRRLKEDVELFKAAIEMIKSLNDKNHE